MTTITTPIDKDLEEFINAEIREGNSETKAHVVRQALRLLREDRAYKRIREAEEDMKEGRVYKGDLRKLVKKLPA